MKRATKIVLAVLVPIALVLLLAGLTLRRPPVAEVDDYGDLRIERRSLPDEKNIRILLADAINSLPRETSWYAWWKVVRAASLGERDAEATKRILEQSSDARNRFRVGLAVCEGYAGTDKNRDLSSGMPDQRAFISAHRLVFEEALSTNDVVTAYSQLLEQLHLVTLLLNMPDDVRELNLSSAWLYYILPECEKMLHQAECRDEWLAVLDRELPRQGAITRAGSHAIRGEFWRSSNGLADGTLLEETFNPWCQASMLHSAVGFIYKGNYQFSPTRALLAKAHRQSCEVVQSGCVTNGYFGAYFFGQPFGWADVVRPNFGGRIVAERQSLRLRYNVGIIKQSENGVACVRVLLACERYRRKYGNYPETLALLVPEFLSAVPLDTFGAGHLRYSREREILWSVGQNMKDDAGSIKSRSGGSGRFRDSNSIRALDMVYPVSANKYEESMGWPFQRKREPKR
jgi:hypothetical protein